MKLKSVILLVMASISLILAHKLNSHNSIKREWSASDYIATRGMSVYMPKVLKERHNMDRKRQRQIDLANAIYRKHMTSRIQRYSAILRDFLTMRY